MSDGAAEAPRADGKKPKPPLDFKHAVAGSCAGMFSKVLMQPFDLIKTRMQVSDKAHAYRGVVDAFRTIVARDGVFGLYTGLTPNLIGSGVSWGLYFFTYNAAKRNWRRWFNQEKLGPGANLLCAAQAGALSITLTNPIWMVKTRLQVQAKDPGSRPYTGLLNAFTRIVREEGPLTLYRGIGPALVLVSNGALQFMCYEELRKFVTARLPNGEKDLHSAHFMAMGACAKAFSATLTYPLQVTRSRLYQRKDPAPAPAAAAVAAGTGATGSSATNTAAGVAAARAPNAAAAAAGAGAAAASGPVSANKYRDMRHVVTHILEHENWRSFYRGLVPHLMKTAPSSAITFFGYETALRLLNRYFPAAPTAAPSSTAPAL